MRAGKSIRSQSWWRLLSVTKRGLNVSRIALHHSCALNTLRSSSPKHTRQLVKQLSSKPPTSSPQATSLLRILPWSRCSCMVLYNLLRSTQGNRHHRWLLVYPTFLQDGRGAGDGTSSFLCEVYSLPPEITSGRRNISLPLLQC